jgi:ribosomal protein S13
MEQKLNQNPKLVKKEEQKLIRILSKDIEGNLSVYVGLTKIKGISWSISNAICKVLGINKSKKVMGINKRRD